MNTFARWTTTLMICLSPLGSPLVVNAQNKVEQSGIESVTDAETGLGTRTWLKEQTEGTNRGEIEPYRAESAGKAYRAYADSIGAKDQKEPVSQVSTLKNN